MYCGLYMRQAGKVVGDNTVLWSGKAHFFDMTSKSNFKSNALIKKKKSFLLFFFIIASSYSKYNVSKLATTSKSSHKTYIYAFLLQAAQAVLRVYQIPKPDSPPESSGIQDNFHYAGILSITALKTAHWHRFSARDNGSFIIMAEKYIYSDCSIGPHSPVQSGFHISQEEIGWNSQHHSKLINETKSHNLKYQFIHLTLYLYWRVTHFHRVALVIIHWALAHDLNHKLNTSKVSGWNTQIWKHTVVYTVLLHRTWPLKSKTSCSNGYTEIKTVFHLHLDHKIKQ